MDPEDLLRAALAVELPAGGDLPREIELIPAGELCTRPHDPRPSWHNRDAAAVVAATREMGTDLPIDYEHQGDRSRNNGQPAPAAGWIKRVFERAGAVWGEVEWTDRAAAMLKAREYRFISPLFMYDPANRDVKRVVGAGLTNDPALYMRAIATAQPTEESMMDKLLEKLRKALGLAADAKEDAILAAATARGAAAAEIGKIAKALGLAEDTDPDKVTVAVAATATARKGIARAAGLAEDASAEDVEKAVKDAKAAATAAGDPDPTKFVPRAEFDRVSERLTALEASSGEEKAAAAVAAAVEAGKIPPAQRDWYMAHAKRDLADFQKFVDAAPVVIAPGTISADPPPDEGAPLTADELAICRATGVTEEQFRESRKALAAQGEPV